MNELNQEGGREAVQGRERGLAGNAYRQKGSPGCVQVRLRPWVRTGTTVPLGAVHSESTQGHTALATKRRHEKPPGS